jgi:hypothetical protein
MKQILAKGKISVLTSDSGVGGWSKEAHIVEYKGIKYVVRKCKTLKRAKSYEEFEKVFGEHNILPKFLGREGKNVFYEYIKGRDLTHKETKDVIYQVGQIAGHINNVKTKCPSDKMFEMNLKELLTGNVASENKDVYIENKKMSIITNPRPMISEEEYQVIMDFYKALKRKSKPRMALDANDINPSNFRLREGKVYFVDVEAIKQRVKGFGIGKCFAQWLKTKREQDYFREGYASVAPIGFLTKAYETFVRLNFLVQSVNYTAKFGNSTYKETFRELEELVRKG